MAKNTAKINVRKNQARLRLFWLITAACNLVHLAAIWWTSGLPPTLWQFFAITFWLGQQAGAMRVLASWGRATLDEMGNLDACADLSDPSQLGLASYAQDLLWVCWALQVLSSAVSSYFSIFYVAVPVFAVAKLWSSVIGPMLSARSQMAQGAAGMGGAQPGQYGSPAGGQPGGALPAGADDPRSRLQRRREEARGGKKR